MKASTGADDVEQLQIGGAVGDGVGWIDGRAASALELGFLNGNEGKANSAVML